MKKILMITSLFCAATIVVCGCFTLDKTPTKTEANTNTDEKTASAVQDENSFTEQKSQYIVKEYKEMIGIFRKGAGKPCRVLETYIFTLPYADRIILAEGFTVSEEKLYCVVEDYTG